MPYPQYQEVGIIFPFIDMTSAISWFVLGYFVVLFAERAQSIIRQLSSSMFGTGFDAYVNILTILSLVCTVFLLAAKNKTFWQSLVDNSVTPDYSVLVLTMGVLLLSGMVHTENTIAPIQFGAYGCLIVAMILRTVQVAQTSGGNFRLWYSLVFVTVFSMAIPVMYHSQIKTHLIFHIIEAVTALVLVVFFTMMLKSLFTGQGYDLLWWIPMLIAAVCDTVIIAMRAQESMNMFVLIFIIASAVLFVAGRILFAVIR